MRWVCVAVLAAVGCGGGPEKPANEPKARPAVVKPIRRNAGELPPPLLPAHVVGKVEEEGTPVAFARRTDREGLVLFASGGRWRARRVGAEGAPVGDTVDVAAAPTGTTLAVLEPAGQGYVAAWLEPVAQNHAVKLAWLGPDGAARGAPSLVTQLPEHVSWLDLFPTEGGGAIALWEVARADRIDVFVSAAPAGGAPGAPVAALRSVLGWESVATPKGLALACVLPATAKAAAGASDKLGKIGVVEIDAAGKVGAPAVVSTDATAQIDVDIASVGGRYVVAWTDEKSIDSAVMLASVEPGGKVASPPKRATPPSGEQVLVRLIGDGGPRALLAWEDLLKAPGEGRLIHLASVDSSAVVGTDRASMVFGASGPPDLVVDREGFAAVTLAAAGRASAGDRSTDEPVWPTFVRFSPNLEVRAAEPIRASAFGGDGVPYLTRALSCSGGECWTLASGAGKNAPLAVVRLPVRPSPWRAPAARRTEGALPRAGSLVALYDGEHVADVASTVVSGDRALVAWVTYFVEGANEGGKKGGKQGEEPLAATLAIRPVSPTTSGDVQVISRRAMSIGGVALATAPGDKPETALAWVARERGEAHVFVTKLGADGKKLAQKRLTVINRKKKGPVPSEPSDVAIAHAGGGDGNDGWIVAWVDTRDDNAEIYVAKIDKNLEKTIPDRRITEAPGDAAEVQIAVRGQTTLLAWADARGDVEGGDADPYVARLETRSLKKLGDETRVFASAAHSRSPSFAPTASGTLLSWIEEAEAPAAKGDKNATPGGLRVALLDERGAVVGAPSLVAGESNGAVTSAAIVCPPSAKRCRGVLTSAVGEAHRMAGFELEPGAPASALRNVATLTGGTAQDVAPTFSSPAGVDLFFADDAVGGTGRVRWMTLVWP